MQRSDYGFLVGREYASLSSGGFIPCCEHLFWWVLVWSTYNFYDVSELPCDNAILCCWDVVESYLDIVHIIYDREWYYDQILYRTLE